MTRASDLTVRVLASTRNGAEARVFLDPTFVGFLGHFPGAPVLPGMCHIDIALRAASKAMGIELDLVSVERARFVRKALPGEEMTIRTAFDRNSVSSLHTIDGETTADLRLLIRRAAASPPGA